MASYDEQLAKNINTKKMNSQKKTSTHSVSTQHQPEAAKFISKSHDLNISQPLGDPVERPHAPPLSLGLPSFRGKAQGRPGTASPWSCAAAARASATTAPGIGHRTNR